VRVHDTGIGIEADKVDHMFEAFSQATSGTTKLYGGTGLGLSICKDLVALMEGSLFAESVLGEGSVFGFDIALPADPLDDNQAISSALQGQTIAIITRSYAMHWSLRSRLLRCGASVMPHGGASAVLSKLLGRPDKPDWLIVDHRLESASGTRLADWLQAHAERVGMRVAVLGGTSRLAVPVRSDRLIEHLAKGFSNREVATRSELDAA
jgi:hypothetical protein